MAIKNVQWQYAISHTIVSVTGSSVTTVAGFIALCFMSFTLGLDLGIVMAKGVIIGVIGCVTILPALILACDKAIEKTKHRVLMPDISKNLRLGNKALPPDSCFVCDNTYPGFIWIHTYKCLL